MRGLEPLAHSMLMCAKRTSEGYFLNGSDKAFDELLGNLHEEIDYALCPKKNIRYLVSVISKIEELFPHSDDMF